ncbi:cytochrome P450 [Amycolatopsis speibonae]|uniref:Cytochrome P450 n=1 Tax=Amycolatopsis speibonae TaxID=1450224 RepID=A0ABV7PCZ7_9PSEU
MTTPVRLVTREFMRDPYPSLRAIREQRAATPIDAAGLRAWVVTRYDDARTLLAHPDVGKDLVANQEAILRASVLRPEKLRGIPLALRRHMLDRDEPDHTRLRGLVSDFFSGPAITAWRPRIEQVTAHLLAGLPFGEEIDLIEHFTRPLARTVTAELLGVPAGDEAPFPAWVNALLTSFQREDLRRSADHLVAFIRTLLRHRAADPGDDVASRLAARAAAGELTENEAIASVHVLMTGGLEPLNGIANAVHALLHHPDQLAALRADPGLLSGCVEETLRYESPFRMLTPRFARAPVPLTDLTIPANEMILVCPAAAGRDPSRFVDPDRFDITRNAKAHLGFGRGSHRCLGAQLGRIEMTVALSALLATAPGIRLAREPLWQPGLFMRRLHTLPVVLPRRS